MSKPSAFTWATSGPITTPTSGKMAAGFVPGERGAAQYFNYLFNLLGQWVTWLTAGILDGNYEVTGNLQVDGTIVGQSTVTGTALHFTTALEIDLPSISSTDNPAGAPGAHHTRNMYGWTFAANTNKVYYPITLPVGAVLKSYTIDLNKGDTTNTVAAGIVYETSSNEILASSGAVSSTGTGLQSLGESGLSITVTTGRTYHIRVAPGGTATPAADTIGNVRVTYTL